MKKSLFIFILAAAAGLCSILFAAWTVDSEKEKITVVETVVEGDAAAAEGILVEIGTHWEGQLLWSTRYRPGSVQAAESSFDFSSQPVRWNDSNPRAWSSSFAGSGEAGRWRNRSTAYVDLDVVSIHFGTVHVASESAATEPGAHIISDDMPYARLLQAAEDQTAAGETRTVTLRLRDYYDYYPLEFSVVGEDGHVYSEASWRQFATEYFKLLVPEDEMLQVTIRKGQEKGVLDLDCHSMGGGYFPIVTSALGDEGYYFSFYLEGADADFEEIEEIQEKLGGQYALYWQPAAKPPKKSSGKVQIDPEQMEKAALLPDGAIPLTMRLDREGEMLYLLAMQKERYILLVYTAHKGELILQQQLTIPDTVFAVGAGAVAEEADPAAGEVGPAAEEAGSAAGEVDPATGEAVLAAADEADPSTAAAEAEGNGHVYFREMTVQEDGILLTWQDSRFVFIARQGEEYRLWCVGVFPVDKSSLTYEHAFSYESVFPYEHAFAFDGTRLALAAFESWDSLDSRLLVYREGQLVYSGYYQYSGELDAALGMDRKIIPWGDRFNNYRRQGMWPNPLHVSFG